jgi:hypothetical protein
MTCERVARAASVAQNVRENEHQELEATMTHGIDQY